MNIVHASEYVDDHSLQHITRCSYIKFCCVSTCMYVASTFSPQVWMGIWARWN